MADDPRVGSSGLRCTGRTGLQKGFESRLELLAVAFVALRPEERTIAWNDQS
jgi:hypothetical protein